MIVAAVVVILLIVGGILVASIGVGSTKPSASGSSTPSMSPSPSPSSSETPGASVPAAPSPSPTVDPAYGAPVAQTVPKNAKGDFGDGVTARIAAIKSITATGTQAGEVSGPAAQVDIELMNGTTADISLGAVAVNAYYGVDKTPASPIVSKSGSAGFSGSLAAGKTATARYVFSVSKEQQKTLVVTIGKNAGSPIVVFQ
jgi:cytoskeletal protein RodZ